MNIVAKMAVTPEYYDEYLAFVSSFDDNDMAMRSYPVAGFIVPYKCYELRRQEKLDRNKMRIRKGRLRLSPNEEAQLIKEETEKRRKLRLQQVREQSKENAAKIRHAVKQEKHKQLMKLATDIKNQLDEEKAERVRHLEQQYDNSLRNIGVGHKHAAQQPDWSEERELIQRAENLRAEARGRAALDKLKLETEQQNLEANKHIIARQHALEVERARAAEVAAMPPPPPDPLQNLEIRKPKPVKMTDINTFSTSHYHLQNEHAVDRAEPEAQIDARDAADLEAERIKERALELKRLRQDQLERARLRHNAALEKELLKHDYNNILHDLSDLQRADRERRQRIVHNIPKQVFEPPNTRMADLEEKQRNLEEQFEDMYMAGTNHLGDISFALDPQPRPATPSREDSLDVTLTDGGTPLQEPTLPGVPPVLRDMTNMPKPRSPGKKPEKVLRSLMDRIKSQREEWITSQSMLDVGQRSQAAPSFPQDHQAQSTVINGDHFYPMEPDESPMSGQQELSPSPEKLARIKSPVQRAPAAQDRKAAMPATEFAEKLRTTNERQQTYVQMHADPSQARTAPTELQHVELAEILKQQEIIMEQKRQLELKLQQFMYEQQKMKLMNQAAQSSQPGAPMTSVPGAAAQVSVAPVINGVSESQSTYSQFKAQAPQGQGAVFTMPQPSVPYSQAYMYPGAPNGMPGAPNQMPSAFGQVPVSLTQPLGQVQPQWLPAQQPGVTPLQPAMPQPGFIPQQQFISSLSSSGMSQRPMNSIPPTHTTASAPMMSSQGQGFPAYQGRPVTSAYQPPSAVLTTDQLATPAWQQPYPPTNAPPGYYGNVPSSATLPSSLQGHHISPGHVPPASLTSQGMSEQMRKVKEYQEHLLARHEQSKKVLDETKAEIKRRREHLLSRYPNLDLSRLEELGAKHLDTHPADSTSVSHSQSLPARSLGQGQGQSVSVSSLLASLAAHPYYAATLSQPDPSKQPGTSIVTTTVATVGTVQSSGIPSHPDINLEANLRKHKLEHIRKSLPFDGDESFQTPVRVYDAYSQKHLDTTDVTETDTSSLTEKGSPALKPGKPIQHYLQQQNGTLTTEESDEDTTLLSERDDESELRQEELRKQLAEIQRQKEDIIRRHQQGQQKLQSKEEELKAKLATLQPEQLDSTLREALRLQHQEQQQQQQASRRQRQLDLSTILEVDTPASTRPSDAGMSGSTASDGESQHSKKSLDFSKTTRETIHEVPEQTGFEDVETQVQKQAKDKERRETVADYSGKNIDDVLERAKRFEQEVLEKLRKQTNAVLFDNEFDSSLEFSVSRRQTSADHLSSGSLTPSSFSTGPLEDTPQSRQSKSAEGSFQQNSSKSWAAELSQYKIPPSNQSDLSFKLMKPDSDRDSLEKKTTKPTSEATIFPSNKNRFKIYSDINQTGSSTDTSRMESSSLESSNLESEIDSLEPDSMNAGAMIQHLKNLQQQLRKGEEERNLLTRKLAEQEQSKSTEPSKAELSQYSLESEPRVSRPFMPNESDGRSELSQYSFTDKSADSSMAAKDKTDKGKSRSSTAESGTSSVEKLLPVRRSPIGDSARMEPRSGLTNGRDSHNVTSTEYSFALSEGRQQRSTSTPGEERRKSALDGTHRSELPSAITVGDKTSADMSSSKSKSSDRNRDLSSYSMPYDSFSGNHDDFETMSPDRNGESSQDSTGRAGMSAEESIECIKKEFEKLDKPVAKVRTFAVNRDGDLIAEQSESDKSLLNGETLGTNMTQFTLSSEGSLKNKTNSKLESFSGISSYTLPELSANTRLSEYSNKSSFVSGSVDSQPKSSSFTSITPDPSLNMTGATTLSQYTLNDTKEQSENGDNYVQERFASLDNLISESKNIIARHKQIISKNKNSEEVPKLPSAGKSPEREKTTESKLPVRGVTIGRSSERATTQGKSPERGRVSPGRSPDRATGSMFTGKDAKKPKSSFLQSRYGEDSNQSENASSWSAQQDSTLSKDTSGNQSSAADENSLDYLAEHSSGITEEPMPDLTSMTLGSELSISEAFNKTEDLSQSSNSLESFEKHEMSEAESTNMSHNFEQENTNESSKSDSLQDIVEARKHNFMISAERRAAAAKERTLANKRSSDDHQVFRAVPVNVVAEPTLSVAVKSTGAERGKSPTTVQPKGSFSGNDPKRSIEPKEKEIMTLSQSKNLNRALQPRGPDDVRAKDPEPVPKQREGGGKPKDSCMFSKFGSKSTSDDGVRSPRSPRSPRGRLAGEIRQFGGSAGLLTKSSPPTPRKTPPKVAPKPQRPKSVEIQSAKPVPGLSKTLSSWKKSRAVTGPPLRSFSEPGEHREAPKNSIKVLPEEAPPALTEEERRKRAEDELYEKNIRAYNPRLFRLQHKLDKEDTSPQTSPPQHQQGERTRDSKKESADNLRKNRH